MPLALFLTKFHTDRIIIDFTQVYDKQFQFQVIECETDQEDAAAARKDNERIRTMYESVLKRFKSALKAGPQDYRDRATFLKRQHTFVQNLVGLVKAVARENGNR